MEVQRFCLVTPLTPQHLAMKETQLLGYTIPKVRMKYFLTYTINGDGCIAVD